MTVVFITFLLIHFRSNVGLLIDDLLRKGYCKVCNQPVLIWTLFLDLKTCSGSINQRCFQFHIQWIHLSERVGRSKNSTKNNVMIIYTYEQFLMNFLLTFLKIRCYIYKNFLHFRSFNIFFLINYFLITKSLYYTYKVFN